MLIPRCKFVVVLEIEHISKFPQSTGKVGVRWHIADSARAETRGRTADVDVEDHQANFNYRTEFTYYLGVGMNKQLHSGNIEFEAVWHLLGSRNKTLIGHLKLDVAQFVGREPEDMLFLLEDAKANVLLTIKLNVQQIKGPTNYHIPKFTAPLMNEKLTNLDTVDSLKGSKKVGMQALAEKRAYINYVQHFRQSPSHPNPLQAVADIVRGGDGFCNIDPPTKPQRELVVDAIADGRKPNRPITEDELREDFISWLYQVA